MTNRIPTPPDARTVIVGVDTHTHVHVAVAIDSWGIRLGDHAFVVDSGTSSASCARPPAIIEDLHTIADLRDPDQIRRDSDAGATRWPRGGAGVGRFHASREREVP